MSAIAAQSPGFAGPPLDLDALKRAPLQNDPFPYVIVPNFVRAEALPGIGRDFPAIEHVGSFPLNTLEYGPAFDAYMKALLGPEFENAVEEKFGVDLKGLGTTMTVRGQCGTRDGKIHTDSRNKLITVLVYMNDAWESAKGRLRLLRSHNDLNAVVTEIPPAQGTLLIFKNEPNAWHGFEPYTGPRRSIQMNWVTTKKHASFEHARHSVSAFFKRLLG